jgi:hypothetical protein
MAVALAGSATRKLRTATSSPRTAATKMSEAAIARLAARMEAAASREPCQTAASRKAARGSAASGMVSRWSRRTLAAAVVFPDMREQGVLGLGAELPSLVDPCLGIQEADAAVILRDGDHLLVQSARELDCRSEERGFQFSALITANLRLSGAIHVIKLYLMSPSK